ncbi:MAG: hypothetical protein JWO36_54 [Myxococcales bacterium]|nr:hypothetical protein [Myxococcales bacterium]
MAKIESSAVNELIDLVARRPLARDSGDELLFAPPKGAQPANASNRPQRKSSVRMVSAPISASPIPHLRLVPVSNPVPRPPVHDHADQTWAVTLRRRLQNTRPVVVAKIAGATLVLIIAGIAIGHFAFSTDSEQPPARLETAHVSAPTIPVAAIGPAAPAPVAVPVVAAPKKPALVDVLVESTPPGATVTLIDNGKSSFIGTTPIDTSLDPTRSYDVVLTRDGQPAHTEHLDPKATQRLTVVLEAPVATKVVAAKSARHHKSKAVAKKKSTHRSKRATKKTA